MGRALFEYRAAKIATSRMEIKDGVLSTSQRTPSEQGGVVSEPLYA